jgi:hypothetical protein
VGTTASLQFPLRFFFHSLPAFSRAFTFTPHTHPCPVGSRNRRIRSLPDLPSASQCPLPLPCRPVGSRNRQIRSLPDAKEIGWGLAAGFGAQNLAFCVRLLKLVHKTGAFYARETRDGRREGSGPQLRPHSSGPSTDSEPPVYHQAQFRRHRAPSLA